jgi:hypothetical protein
MSAETKKGYGSTIVMIVLGVLALYGGVHWLVVLIPAAIFVRYSAMRLSLAKSRN